jgi:hypothetical protein
LKDAEFDKGGRPEKTGKREVPVNKSNLSDYGISKNESSTFQKIASLVTVVGSEQNFILKMGVPG